MGSGVDAVLAIEVAAQYAARDAATAFCGCLRPKPFVAPDRIDALRFRHKLDWYWQGIEDVIGLKRLAWERDRLPDLTYPEVRPMAHYGPAIPVAMIEPHVHKSGIR
jgi:hypothetical protein